jgi:hypothetical protein
LPKQIAKQERRRLLEFALAHLRNSAKPRDPVAYVGARLREIGFHLAKAIPQEIAHAAALADATRIG